MPGGIGRLYRMLREFWRQSERLIPIVEMAVQANKVWGVLQRIEPSPMDADAYESELRLVSADPELERAGRLRLSGHLERDGQVLIRLWLGRRLVRRGHIGRGHEEPHGSVFIPGPHIHYPTSAFLNIDTRSARSRVYHWEIPESVPLLEAISSFAEQVNIFGEPLEIRQ